MAAEFLELRFLLRREEDLCPEVVPLTHRSTVASRRQIVAAHKKPKLYFPRSADLPAERKFRRPRTYAPLLRRMFSLYLLYKNKSEWKVNKKNARLSLRHETSSYGLKEQRNGTKCAGEKASDATAKSQDPKEERTDSEE